MGNIIDAICGIVKNPKFQLKAYSDTHNRANNMGEALEEYVKDIFAGTVGENDLLLRNKKISDSFSYLGNKNNPPDSILKNGDAIEVKKIESNDSGLALNSSYPKSKLFSNSPMISSECRDCEKWEIKDMIYAVGIVKNNVLKSLSFVYGTDYCADKQTYEKIKNTIKDGVESIPNVEFAETKELGRVNRVDPLGITYLRVRGMWGIDNPFKVFNYVYNRDYSKEFNFMAIINKEKLEEFDNINKLYILKEQYENLKLKEISIKNPNNPAKLIPALLITYYV
ncbi:MAG: NgoPII family restriction endonuclease [Rikenellaceae bacterium]